MVRGDAGDNVRALQQTLLNNNYPVGTVDGVFGEMTQISVISFQRKNNLDPDGEVGTATCNALIKLSNSELIAASPSSSTTPTGTSTSTTVKVLKRGDSGQEVTFLQNALRSRGFSNQSVNGQYDLETENTVKRLQLLEGLPITGEFDGVTRARLDDFLRKDAANSAATNPPPTQTPPTQVYTPQPPSPVNTANTSTTNSGSSSSPTTTTAQNPRSNSGNTELRGYTVVIPTRGNDILNAVRGIAPNATVGRNRLGNFVNAGSYGNRFDAESLSNKLKAKGFDARVVER
jgi:peptidoglycan hydrolase-like protein with peptidoglycan-binding domain